MFSERKWWICWTCMQQISIECNSCCIVHATFIFLPRLLQLLPNWSSFIQSLLLAYSQGDFLEMQIWLWSHHQTSAYQHPLWPKIPHTFQTHFPVSTMYSLVLLLLPGFLSSISMPLLAIASQTCSILSEMQ